MTATTTTVWDGGIDCLVYREGSGGVSLKRPSTQENLGGLRHSGCGIRAACLSLSTGYGGPEAGCEAAVFRSKTVLGVALDWSERRCLRLLAGWAPAAMPSEVLFTSNDGRGACHCSAAQGTLRRCRLGRVALESADASSDHVNRLKVSGKLR